jgi:hypothetical protein
MVDKEEKKRNLKKTGRQGRLAGPVDLERPKRTKRFAHGSGSAFQLSTGFFEKEGARGRSVRPIQI